MDTIQQFAEEIAGQIKGYLPREHQDVKCEVMKCLKNNGVYMTGISFVKNDGVVGLNVYMEPYFEVYQQDWTLKEIMEDIAVQVTEGFENEQVVRAVEIGHFEDVRDFLQPALVNTKANRQMLQTMPHMKAEDLSVICQIRFPMQEGIGSVKVTEGLLRQWEIGKEQLFKQTFENTKKPGIWKLQTIESCIAEIFSGEDQQMNLLDVPEDFLQEKNEGSLMYVLSNASRINGAAAMVCPDVMEKVDGLFPGGFYILPASINECMIVPKETGVSPKELRELVSEINREQVSEEEVLSDHVYEYDKERGRIRKAIEPMEKKRDMER